MKYKIFNSMIYPSIKASFEANGVIVRDEYKPATDPNGLDTFLILPMTISTIVSTDYDVALSDINDRIEKLLKECDIKYAKHLMDFRLPNWYEYELMFD